MTKSLSYKMKLATLLLGLCLTHVLCETEANESTESTTTTALSHTTSLPQPEITATKAEPDLEHQNARAPDHVQTVTVSDQNETSISLEWIPVLNILTYRIEYNESGNTIKNEVNGSAGELPVKHVVSNLNSGTTYNFTLFTLSGNLTSPGFVFPAATAPSMVDDFKAVWQDETSITLQWSKVNNISDYVLYFNGSETNITAKDESELVTYSVSSLDATNQYEFTLFTVLNNVRSSGKNITAVTAPSNAEDFKAVEQNETSITLQWSKVKNISDYVLYFNGSETNITAKDESELVTYSVSSLDATNQYEFTLFTVLNNVRSSGKNITAVTAPSNAEDFKAVEQNETSITLQWSKVKNISLYVFKFNGNETTVTAPGGSESVKHLVSSLMNGTQYDFTLLTVFENVTSSGANILAATAPSMVDDFKAVGQNETSITLQWSKVHISDYVLYFNGSQTNITAEDESELVTYNVSSLDATNQYEFTLFTVLNNVSSTGKNLSAVTAPLNVRVVSTKRFLTGVTLQWNKIHEKTTYILDINGSSVRIPIDDQSSNVTYTVEPLKPGTEYPYILYTVFHKVNSSGFEDVTVTVINCTESPWSFTNSAIDAKVEGVFSFGNATNGSRITHYSPGGGTVSFTDLYPGSTYKVYLWYTKEGLSKKPLLQCEHNLTIIPPDIQVHCVQGAAAHAIHLNWDVPAGVWTRVEVNVTGKESDTVGENGELTATIGGLQPAKTYKVSAVFEVKSTESGFLRSKVAETTCSTYPGGVIAGSVLAVLLFCLLICLAVFIWLRKPFRKESYMDSFKPSSAKYNDIPVEKFPDYFYEMSRDEDRAFIEEYEGFQPVGTEQTHKTAEFPENKPKNRFTNVLPYDWSRVTLSTIQHDETSDYINACYIPGHGNTRQYIAAQGPLPTTVNDFWRMIWEQRVQGVVMVTNCTEGGRVKCDQYWPLDSTPCRYGDFLITINSEHRETNWTLREFGVKHTETSEERTVNQFHFTAWPDHGVPEGTEALIQFRGLVRQHIENEGARAPTVVHCSAGVGRTGTIIALDVLLQQLEQEGKVGVASFVHKMRLSRPLMVQTESQYAFLHQCILNFLESNSRPEDNLYENAEMIYENATALREFHSFQSTNRNV